MEQKRCAGTVCTCPPMEKSNQRSKALPCSHPSINDKQENTAIIHYRDIFINSYCRFLVGIINKKDLKIFQFSIQRRLFLSVVVFLISRQPHEGQPCLVGQPEGQPLHHAEDEPGDQLAVLVEDIRRVVPHGGLHDRVVAGVRDLGQLETTAFVFQPFSPSC